MKRKTQERKPYREFYGVCWYNHFRTLFSMWDVLDGILTDVIGYNTLAQYQLL